MDPWLQRLRLVGDISAKIGRGERFDDILETLYQETRELIPCDRLALGFLHADGRTIVLGPVRTSSPPLLATGYKASIENSSLRDFIRAGATRVINDLSAHSQRTPQSFATQQLIREGMNASLAVRLAVADRVIGILWFNSRARDAYQPEHEEFLKLLAAQLAISLERARLASRLLVDDRVKNRLKGENARLRETNLEGVVGSSPAWRRALDLAFRVASTDATVLIRGETGTGKELVARAIHRCSRRAARPFVAVNCAAFAPDLVAGELFGHERGAFTGAIQRRRGRLELAEGGTLFLDEVGDLPPDTQVLLLRVLQERAFERIGGVETLHADVRIVAATNRNLDVDRASGRFRDDLFFRLNVFPIETPPLRERQEDIEPLVRFFLERCARKLDRDFPEVDPASLEKCRRYAWPGNVRELENLVERSAILHTGGAVVIEPEASHGAIPTSAFAFQTLETMVRQHLLAALKKSKGKVYGADGAACLLGLKPSTLQAKLRKYGIDVQRDFVDPEE